MTTGQESTTPDLDVLIVGAGMGGITHLANMRRLGLTARVIDAAGGPGGTWYWNRYPGARFDSESYSYQFFLSKEVLDEWTWSEHFAGQPETERYANFVVDRLDLRRYMTFGVRADLLEWDESSRTWLTTLSDGSVVVSRFVVTAVGILSAVLYPPVPGREHFRGVSAHTAVWPREGIDFRGKRVAVIGTGASGVQLISSIASEVRELTVFQRTPNWCCPLRNSAITAEQQAELKANINELHDRCMASYSGFIHEFRTDPITAHTPEQREAIYERLWESPGFAKLLANFKEVMTSEEYNAEFSAFLERKIRARVRDKRVADLLVPDHGYAMKRPPFETGYYEVYNQHNVELVDLRATPLLRITPDGLQTTQRTYEFDVIVYATGFDAITGSLERMDIRAGERTLREAWLDGPRTFMGAQSPGFPNLFFLGGPQSGGGNVPRVLERQSRFLTGLLSHATQSGATRVEATDEAERQWVQHVLDLDEGSLAAGVKLDYTYGVNVPGKKVLYRHYRGGLAGYTAQAEKVEACGYEGFRFA